MLEELIAAWHDAVDARDLAAARALVTDPVDVSGPRGARSVSADEFADWIVRSGIRLRRVSDHPIDGTTMVVAQEATWPDSDPGAAPASVATLFRARDGAIAVVHRFDSLEDALHAAGRHA